MISVLIVEPKTNFIAQHLLTPTFNRAVDTAVVSSFGQLEHPGPQQVLIGAVSRCVTAAALNQEEGNGAAQQHREAQLHCHSDRFTHRRPASEPVSLCDLRLWWRSFTA